MTNAITEGDKAPDFDLPINGGDSLSLSSLKGQNVVLYFYPKDDTPGCTTEAIGFTENKAAFEKAGARVVGVSKDTVAKHEKFIAKHGLKVTLASDEEGSMLEHYGVWVEKKNYGRTYMGIERSTFLIDSEGVVRRIWRKVRVKGHVDAVLEAARTL